MTAIVWLRRALREYDNTALVQAANDHDELILLYVVDTEYFADTELGSPRVTFWHNAVSDLRDRLADENKTLTIRHGNPVEVVPEVAGEHDVDAVYVNHDYTPYAKRRDEAVAAALDCPFNSFQDIVLHEKDEIMTNKGTPYQVFTYYHKKWKKREKPRPAEPAKYETQPIDADGLPSLGDLGFERHDYWEGTREAAKERLEQFKEYIADYDDDRDYPAKDKTARLSPHMKFGTLSPREVYWASERMRPRVDTESGIDTWQQQLAWRDFYMQLLHHYPRMTDEPFQDQYASIDWHWDEDHQQYWRAFCAGETGYPFVDAGMRQLRETGWMHNRLRMVVTSFAAKDLHIDWRRLHSHFKRHFVDAEVSLMIGGIQWAYSNGTDAQPYFRVFNPWTQGERYDPDGSFIREWVPELQDVPDEHIHKPHEMPKTVQQQVGCVIGDEYPAPIVDHSEERETAISMFEQARDDD